MFINHEDLPIEIVTRKGLINKNCFLVKSRLEFIVDGIEIALIGSSYGKDKNLCVEKSKNEIIERFYSHRLIASGELFKSRNLAHLKDNLPKFFKRSQVTLGSGVDATGLSFNTKEYADSHAISEVIERHWLANIWYKRVALMILERHKLYSHELLVLCLSDFDVPFVIAVVCDEKRKLLFCGSAIKNNFQDSKNHSVSEAYMLYEGYLAKKSYATDNQITKSQIRISSLNETVFNNQVSHLNSLIKTGNNIKYFHNSYSITHIIEASNLKVSDFYIIDFYQSNDKNVVKAINLNALSPKRVRKNQKKITEDPFY